MACGGGGAAVGPAVSPPAGTGGTTTPALPAPTFPSASIVSTAGIAFTPATITIKPGSTVSWQIVGATHNITFGVNKPTGGDAGDTAPGNSVSRTFPTVGNFPYQCTRHSGMTGQVIVQDSASSANTPTPARGVVVQVTAIQFTPAELSIARGETVTWEFAVASGIAFKDRAPNGGNIAAAGGARVSRTFADAGDYDYFSTLDRNIKGRVRVK